MPELLKSFWDREQRKKTEKSVKQASSEEEKKEIRERLNLTNQKIEALKEELVLMKEGLKLGIDWKSEQSIKEAIAQNEEKIRYLLAERKGLERKILTPKEQAEIVAAREFREVSEATTSERLFGFSDKLFREAETRSLLEQEGWHARWNVAFQMSEIGKADQAEELLTRERALDEKDSLVLFMISLDHARSGRLDDAKRVFKEAQREVGKIFTEREEIAIKIVDDYLKGIEENEDKNQKQEQKMREFLSKHSELEKKVLEEKTRELFNLGIEDMLKKGRFEELRSAATQLGGPGEYSVLATLGAIVHRAAEQEKRQEEEESMKEVEEELKKAA